MLSQEIVSKTSSIKYTFNKAASAIVSGRLSRDSRFETPADQQLLLLYYN
jgi:hypothetical protein